MHCCNILECQISLLILGLNYTYLYLNLRAHTTYLSYHQTLYCVHAHLRISRGPQMFTINNNLLTNDKNSMAPSCSERHSSQFVVVSLFKAELRTNHNSWGKNKTITGVREHSIQAYVNKIYKYLSYVRRSIKLPFFVTITYFLLTIILFTRKAGNYQKPMEHSQCKNSGTLLAKSRGHIQQHYWMQVFRIQIYRIYANRMERPYTKRGNRHNYMFASVCTSSTQPFVSAVTMSMQNIGFIKIILHKQDTNK